MEGYAANRARRAHAWDKAHTCSQTVSTCVSINSVATSAETPATDGRVECIPGDEAYCPALQIVHDEAAEGATDPAAQLLQLALPV